MGTNKFRHMEQEILLVEEILHHLGCIKPYEYIRILGYLLHQLVSRISEPSTV